MTEVEWLACDDPTSMVNSVAKERPDPRRWRLFGCACCRAVLDTPWPQRCRDVIEVAERFADGGATERELNDARSLACQAAQNVITAKGRAEPARVALALRLTFAADIAHADRLIAFRMRVHCSQGTFRNDAIWKAIGPALLRDIFPFRPVAIPPEWRTDTVLALARQMYESRDFAAMPILADALMDAGCSDDAILEHCRGPGPHVRGCFCVDAILGKS